MKKLITISFIILAINLYSQDYIISISQDLRLAVTKDILGNDPPQIDAVLTGTVSWKSLHADVNYEYAGLDSPFHRISIGGGIHYRYKFFEIGQSFNYGVIIRNFSKTLSWGTNSYLALIHKRFRLIGSIQITERTEWGDMIRWSGFVGLGYTI